MRAILFVAALMLAASLHAAPKPSAEGQSQPEHVALITKDSSGSSCPSGMLQALRQLPDGTNGGEFVVPAGKLLVLSDFGFGMMEKTNYGQYWTTKGLITAHVWAGEPDRSRPGRIRYQTSVALDADMLEIGQTWIDRSLESGVQIAPGHRICVGADYGWDGVNRVGVAASTKLYGYLIDQ